MTDHDADPTWAVLDPAIRPSDPGEYLRVAMRWHFGADTGSPFWLRRAENFGFDPVSAVHDYEDLAMFPNVVDELRRVAVEDLIPRGYGPNPPGPAVFESGGVVGGPRRVVVMSDWLEAAVDRLLAGPAFAGREPANILAAVPTGPHRTGTQYARVAARQNRVAFTVDIDPRWIRTLIGQGKTDEVKAYVGHVLDQIEHVLETQRVGLLAITPPLLHACAGRPRLAELINSRVAVVCWSGAAMTMDERFKLAYEDFPDVTLISTYSSTLILQDAGERGGLGADDELTYDPYSPVVTFRVVDPETRRPVAFGQRGQVVTTHVSKGLFLPNNLERDTAVRVPGRPGQVGDSISGLTPLDTVGDEILIEGIY